MHDLRKSHKLQEEENEAALKAAVSETAFDIYQEHKKLERLSSAIGALGLQDKVAAHHELYKNIQKEKLRLQIMELDEEKDAIEARLPALLADARTFNALLEGIIIASDGRSDETDETAG